MRILAIAAWALLSASLAWGAGAAEAQRLLDEGDPSAALTAARGVLKQADDPDAHWVVARAATRLQRFGLAEKHLAIVRELTPNRSGLTAAYGDLEMARANEKEADGKPKKARKNYVRAAEYYEKALDLNPEATEIIERRALALAHAGGDEQEVVRALEQWVATNPQSVDNRILLARLYRSRGDLPRAQLVLSSLPAGSEIPPESSYAMALALYAVDEFDRAREWKGKLPEGSADWREKGLQAIDDLTRDAPFDAADRLLEFLAASPPEEQILAVGEIYLRIHGEVARRLKQAGGSTGLPEAQMRVSPVYPPRAKMSGAAGHVHLLMVIEDDGSIGELKVLGASASLHAFANAPAFTRAALVAARQWVFTPATRDGRTVPYPLPITLEFRPR